MLLIADHFCSSRPTLTGSTQDKIPSNLPLAPLHHAIKITTCVQELLTDNTYANSALSKGVSFVFRTSQSLSSCTFAAAHLDLLSADPSWANISLLQGLSTLFVPFSRHGFSLIARVELELTALFSRAQSLYQPGFCEPVLVVEPPVTTTVPPKKPLVRASEHTRAGRAVLCRWRNIHLNYCAKPPRPGAVQYLFALSILDPYRCAPCTATRVSILRRRLLADILR